MLIALLMTYVIYFSTLYFKQQHLLPSTNILANAREVAPMILYCINGVIKQ